MPGKLARYIGYMALVCAAGLIMWIIAVRYFPPQWLYADKIHRVEAAIVKIEEYKTHNDKYPPQGYVSPETSDIFYEADKSGYRIGFNVGFDEEYHYDSKSKKWSF